MGVKEQMKGAAAMEPHLQIAFRWIQRARIKTPLLCQEPAFVLRSPGRPARRMPNVNGPN
jgi:hypothetical protein